MSAPGRLRARGEWIARVLVLTMLVIVPASTSAQSISSSRDLVALYGVDADVLRQLHDGGPIAGDEQASLWKTLYAARRLSLVEIDRWAERNVSVESLSSSPDEYRGRLFRLRGTLLEVVTESPPAAASEQFELPRYFRCRIAAGATKTIVTVFATAVPDEWLVQSAVVEQRVGFDGIFVKLAGSMATPEPVFVAPRVAWYPRNMLGDLGFDSGLLAPVRDNTRTPITSSEREAFYQLIDCVRRADNGQLLRAAEQHLAQLQTEAQRQKRPPEAVAAAVEMELFNRPEKHHGELFLIEGTARRVTLIRVADEDIRGRMGIDHYYQMEVFTVGSQSNPIVICLSELPEGLPRGDNIYEQVRIPAFFFKKWAYRVPVPSDAVAAGKPDHRLQLAPLLIGRAPLWQPQAPKNPWNGIFTGLLILLLLGAAWWSVWRYTRDDRQFRRKRIDPLFEPEGGKSLNESGIDAPSKPDFSGLK